MTSLTKANKREFSALLIGCVAIYILAFSISYLSDPLALSPQLDARENLELAEAFQVGEVPDEPFYRAVLYPYILSFQPWEPVSPSLAQLLGLIAHFLNGFLVYRLSLRIWPSIAAAAVACILYLANPASLFYSLQVLDITLGSSFFLAGLVLVSANSKRMLPVLMGGLLFGLSVAIRPHFLPVVLVVPLALLILSEKLRWQAAFIWVPVLGVLLGMGLINLRHSGDFRILPWQGAYNLWAANKPGANGLYFKQAVDLSQRGDATNPARVESVYLYGQAHPEERPPYSIDAMNTYWRGQFLDHLREKPFDVARLWLFKAYAVVNSYEQYNNLTFSFHKERLPMLRYNPLNWGILLILGTLGLVQLWRIDSRKAVAALLIMLAYASMLILFYASARFRLPLVPLMAVLAAGAPACVIDSLGKKSRLMGIIVAVIVAGLLTFSSFAGIRNMDTHIQDRLLMANAYAELGRDTEAARWARGVLETSPGRHEAVTIYALSYFNLRLEDSPSSKEFGTWDDQARWLQLTPTQDPATAAVFACYLWHWDRQDDATGIWQQIASNHPDPTILANRILSMLNKDAAALTPEDLVLKRLLEEN